MFPHLFNNSAIHQSEQDQTISGKLIPAGYVNATAMCQANGKKLSNYTRLESAKAYAEEVALDAHLRASSLVVELLGTPNGDPSLQGTYVHPDIALHIGQWISPKFALWCNRVLLKVLHPDFDPNDKEFIKSKDYTTKMWDDLRFLTKDTFWQLTDTVKVYLDSGNATEDEMKWLYCNCLNKINLKLFGKDAKTIREELGIGKSKLNRDHFGPRSLRRIEQVQELSSKFANQGQHPLKSIDSAFSLYAYKDILDYNS